MGTGLVSFVFNTLRKRLNDVGNEKYWLPKKLQAADDPKGGGRLLPLRQSQWDLGQITGTSGTTFRDTIKGQWWMALPTIYKKNPKVKAEQGDHQAIGCPKEPWPRLTLPEVTIHGLDNVSVLAPPDVRLAHDGYRIVVPLQLGVYNGQGELPKLSQLRIEGQYVLKQCLCSARATKVNESPPESCDGWVESVEIEGRGGLKLTLTGVFVDVTLDLQVTGEGPARALHMMIVAINVRGTDGNLPKLNVDALTIGTSWTWMANNLWVPQAKKALESEDGLRGLLANLHDAINQPGSRERFAGLFTQQLNQALDDILGKVPPGELPSGIGQPVPNPVDQYLFDRVRLALSHPASSAYLPRTVYGFASPPLEPFQIGQISLGNSEHAGIQLEDLRATQARVIGISNIKAPGELLVFRPAVIDAVLALSRLEPAPQVTIERDGSQKTLQVPAPPLQVAGDFAMNVEGEDEPYTGRFTLKLQGPNVLASLEVSGAELDELQITFKKLEIESPLDKTSIEVEINSEFKDVINQLINQDAFKRKALQGVNERAAQSLGAISQTATANVRKTVAARLDGSVS